MAHVRQSEPDSGVGLSHFRGDSLREKRRKDLEASRTRVRQGFEGQACPSTLDPLHLGRVDPAKVQWVRRRFVTEHKNVFGLPVPLGHDGVVGMDDLIWF